MGKYFFIILGITFFSLTSFSQIYPDNEVGQYQDMLTPAYYNAPNGGDFRNEINKFVHFARATPFQHPFQNNSGQIPTYIVGREFGEEIIQNNFVVQHHPAIDMYISNGESTTMYASIDGIVATYSEAPKYRDYLTITKNIEDSIGNVIGKMVVLYGHIDLNLDELDGLTLDGQTVNKGDIVSKNLYAGTVGGAHLHFEIRYYKPTDIGTEEYYGWSGGSDTYTEPSAGIWTAGFWNPNIGYGFANPNNHWSYLLENMEINSQIFIYPNPADDFIKIELDNEAKSTVTIIDLMGRELIQQNFVKELEFNIASLQTGIYLIKIINGDRIETRKILKK